MNIQDQTVFDASSYVYSVDFVDETLGASVSEYILDLEYEDNSGGGNSVTVAGFMSFTQNDFDTNEAGYKQLSDITLTSAALAAATGTSQSTVTAGDNYVVTGYLVMNDGSRRDGSESSASVNGSTFRGHFGYTMPLACQSNLDQTVTYSSMPWCGGTITGSVDIIGSGGGAYNFSDWSFGAYTECYGASGLTGDHTFLDVCSVVTLIGGADQYGDAIDLTATLVGNVLTIDVDNVGAYSYEDVVTELTFASAPGFVLN